MTSFAHLPSSFIILKYLAKLERIFFADKECNVYSYFLSLTVLEIQRLVTHNLVEEARNLYGNVPKASRELLSSFLQASGYYSDALDFTDDQMKKFNLSLTTNNPEFALSIIEDHSSLPSSKVMWQAIGEYALKSWDPSLALKAIEKTGDLTDNFILKKSLGVHMSDKENKTENNLLLFLVSFLNNSPVNAFNTLISSKRFPEAALFARTWLGPDHIFKAVDLWKRHIKQNYESWNDFSESILDPSSAPDMFKFLPENRTKENTSDLVDTLKGLNFNIEDDEIIKQDQQNTTEIPFFSSENNLIQTTICDESSFSEPSCIIQKEASSIVSTSSEENTADILNSFTVSEEAPPIETCFSLLKSPSYDENNRFSYRSPLIDYDDVYSEKINNVNRLLSHEGYSVNGHENESKNLYENESRDLYENESKNLYENEDLYKNEDGGEGNHLYKIEDDIDPIDKKTSSLEEDWDLDDESLSFTYDPDPKNKKKSVSWANKSPNTFSFSSDSLVDKYMSDFSSNYHSG